MSLNIAPKRNAINKRLSTGQIISLTGHEEKSLRHAYDYMAGYAKRKMLTKKIATKTKEYNNITASSPKNKSQLLDLSNSPNKNLHVDLRTEEEVKTDEKYILKDEIAILEDKLKTFENLDHVISLKDIEIFLKNIGLVVHKKYIQNMIWEIDEKGDEVIDWEEFQLTYFRNLQILQLISDTPAHVPAKDIPVNNEPNTFFHIMEFTIFDSSHKGTIEEDDCMEILYARYGREKLEKELMKIFGDKLRGTSGGGTLDINTYLATVTAATGERAIVF
eukprot:TRINITY_DN52668_c0_g1_i1.p1 TRINITY_DN52668_c0_g1~~TRINITY_DN52668_c0_g1_i1.p1  ORF type:complete len:276 (+),score=-4.65 TRINITY_DN52668_c0_g1_i1:36-863(+)